jgi:TonB dependent receptor/Carboxypeptidase regulatory-like domain
MRLVTLLFLASLFLCVSLPGFADVRTTGELSGYVVSEDSQPLPGASLTLTGEALIQQSIIQYADEKGYFRFLNLKPGTYFLNISLQGFSAKKYQVDVEVGSNKSIRTELVPASTTAEVTVTDTVPLIDSTSTQIAQNYSQKTINEVPIRREFIDFMDLVPGVNDRGAYGAGGKDEDKYSRGSATSGYRLNGVDVSNINFGTTWVNPSFDTIQEIEVVGIGTSAEYGNYIGTTVNVVTKSGTNQYHGGASYFYTSDKLQADNSGGIVDLKPEQNNYTNDVSLTLGGPILKDKLLFFANYGLNAYATAPFDSEFFNHFRQHHVQGRIDLLANKNNTVSGMFNSDPATDGNLGLVAGSGPEIAYDENFRTDTYFANWNNLISAKSDLEVKFAGFNGHYDRNPIAPLDERAVTDATTGIKYNTFGFVSSEKNKRNTVTASLTHYADNFLNVSHAFKFGVEFERANTRRDTDQTGGASFFIYPVGAYSIVLGLTGYNEHTDASTNREGAFAQDDIRVNNKLTLNLGLRYDRPTMRDEGGNFDLATFNFLAPRLGMSYDIGANGKKIAHLHYGRYYDKITTYGPIGYAGTGFANPINYYLFFSLGPVDPTNSAFFDQVLQPQNLFQTFTLGGIPVDPNLTGPHTDVFNAGYEMMLNDNLALSFDYIYKKDRDFIIQSDRTPHTYEPFQYTDPFSHITKTLYRRTDNLNPDYILSNNSYYKRDHQFGMVTVRNRQSKNLLMEGSLVYERSTGNMENDAGAAWSVDSFSYHTDPNFTKDPFQNGFLTFDRTWQFKFLASYDLPHQIRISGDYRLLSGRPYAPTTPSSLVQDLNATSFYEILLEPRGSRRWQATNSLNFRISKIFGIGSVSGQPAQVEVIADVFNLFNDDAPDSIYSQTFDVYPISGKPAFGKAQTLIPPRTLRLGARFTF